MRTLILNGSPHANGDTAALLFELRRLIQGEVVQVNAYERGIAPCNDCRWCWEHPGCVLRDGMDGVYTVLAHCDAVVIASPLYFSQLTGPLLGLASRFQTYYAARRFRGEKVILPPKKGLIILTGGGDGCYTPARDTALCLLKMVNAVSVGEVLSLRTDELPAGKDLAAMEGIARAAALLNGV